MKYLVIYEKTATGYSAYPLDMHISGLREDGDPIPQPTTLADHVSA